MKRVCNLCNVSQNYADIADLECNNTSKNSFKIMLYFVQILRFLQDFCLQLLHIPNDKITKPQKCDIFKGSISVNFFNFLTSFLAIFIDLSLFEQVLPIVKNNQLET